MIGLHLQIRDSKPGKHHNIRNLPIHSYNNLGTLLQDMGELDSRSKKEKYYLLALN
jgi:hypothetical protein